MFQGRDSEWEKYSSSCKSDPWKLFAVFGTWTIIYRTKMRHFDHANCLLCSVKHPQIGRVCKPSGFWSTSLEGYAHVGTTSKLEAPESVLRHMLLGNDQWVPHITLHVQWILHTADKRRPVSTP